jgi:small neutral amino acid transporter SnatA (MarC family)
MTNYEILVLSIKFGGICISGKFITLLLMLIFDKSTSKITKEKILKILFNKDDIITFCISTILFFFGFSFINYLGISTEYWATVASSTF